MIRLIEASAWATLAICCAQRGGPLWMGALFVFAATLSAVLYIGKMP